MMMMMVIPVLHAGALANMYIYNYNRSGYRPLRKTPYCTIFAALQFLKEVKDSDDVDNNDGVDDERRHYNQHSKISYVGD